MKKRKEYRETRFSVETLKEAIAVARNVAARAEKGLSDSWLTVEHDDSTWHYDTIEEFFADFRQFQRHAILHLYGGEFELKASFSERDAIIEIAAPSRVEVEAICDVFEKYSEGSKLAQVPLALPSRTVFIGHGRSSAWRDLKDHLHDKHGIEIEAYESGARAGRTIRDVLEEMAARSSFAILVLTGEDEQVNGKLRARQNIIHEAGLFQGRLGFARAILLIEEGVEEFSNLQGVEYIPFTKGNIKEAFGEVLATLKREFAR